MPMGLGSEFHGVFLSASTFLNSLRLYKVYKNPASAVSDPAFWIY